MPTPTEPCAICQHVGAGARWRFVLASRLDGPPLDTLSVHKRCYRNAEHLVEPFNAKVAKHGRLFLSEVHSED